MGRKHAHHQVGNDGVRGVGKVRHEAVIIHYSPRQPRPCGAGATGDSLPSARAPPHFEDLARDDEHRQQPDRDDDERRRRGFGETFVGGERVRLCGQGVEVERADDQRGRQLLHDVDKNEQTGRQQAAAQHRNVHPAQRRPFAKTEAARGIVHARRDLAEAGLDRLQGDGEEARQVGVHQRRDAAGQQQARIGAEERLPRRREPVVQPRQRNEHAHRDHRPRHRIAEPDHTVEHLRQPRARQPRGVAEHDREHDGDDRRHRGEHEAVAREVDEARTELRIALGKRHLQQQHRRQQKAQQQRHEAGERRKQAERQGQAQAHRHAGLARGVVEARPPPRHALEGEHQHHEGEQSCRKLGRRDAVTEREPRAIDPGGEGLHAEVRHRTEVCQRLHQRQRRPRHHRRTRQRQRHAEETSPRPEPERAPGLEHAARALEKGRARNHVHIRIEHEHEHRDRAAHRAHIRKPVIAPPPLEDLAQPALQGADELQEVGVHVGHHIGRHRQRQHQRPLEEAPTRKIEHRRQPRRGHADRRHAQPDTNAQDDRVPHELAQHRVGQVRPRPARLADEDVREHGQHGRGDQHRDHHGRDRQGRPLQARGALSSQSVHSVSTMPGRTGTRPPASSGKL